MSSQFERIVQLCLDLSLLFNLGGSLFFGQKRYLIHEIGHPYKKANFYFAFIYKFNFHNIVTSNIVVIKGLGQAIYIT